MQHFMYEQDEKSSCGVGFLVSVNGKQRCHDILKKSLLALERVEHRGGQGKDHFLGDGAGVMTSIPYEIFGLEKETFAVASLFTPRDLEKFDLSLHIFEETFNHFGLGEISYRDVPIDKNALSPLALVNMPKFKHAIIKRPSHCRTLASFEKLLYMAKQMTRTAEKSAGIHKEFFFSSLSSRTIIYKALCKGEDLSKFYLDLKDPRFKTNFSLFHRRFSTNTRTTWDKAQPFRLIAHNGEINTIEGNKAWSISREKALGLRKDELITHDGVSDSGNLNGIVEGLKNRSCIPQTSEILSILMPPAEKLNTYYNFWSRGMEPWDGPSMVVYSDGKSIGARLDRNGLRPCRWTRTKDYFYLCSETGAFTMDAGDEILEKGSLSSGSSVSINALSGAISFLDPSQFPDNKDACFEPHLEKFSYKLPPLFYKNNLHTLNLFNYSKEDLECFIDYMILTKKGPLGSMGDTARLAFLSDLPRSLFDFFYQDFAQVTNPPLDYIREKSVTDMRVYLGRKPNIFEPKELLPPKPGLVVEGPILSLGQLEHLADNLFTKTAIKSKIIKTLFPKGLNKKSFLEALAQLGHDSIEAVKEGNTILILSDRGASKEELPIPSLLALRAVSLALNRSGRRLRVSIVLDSGDIKNSHHIACLMGFGATAVCPYLILERAFYGQAASVQKIFPKEREERLIEALTSELLRIMAKMGISVLRSYQGSQLFSLLGLAPDLVDQFFPGRKSLVGGMSIEMLVEKIKKDALVSSHEKVKKSFIYKEHTTGKRGESHSLTTQKSRIVHKLVAENCEKKREDYFREYKKSVMNPVTFLRHLLSFKSKNGPILLDKVDSVNDILKTFGSGGMSFGAISAESQKDLILAFKEIGGRCNSGEGGENPYYLTEGIFANIKQVASGRFGVTCEYLITGDEVQIKIAQGAKPGEGGQLMGAKITPEIARSRFSSPGVDLISPAPQHDIYSIEDLQELIYEFKELKPSLKVSVKLVSGRNIGAVAVGVVKAGADLIQISGGDGATGAASLLSMKHAGLPLETGLIEVHHSLVQAGLRERVLLRADGGLLTGHDIILSAILGADQFDFGKILLVAEGCIMARVCEKNTCPTGIATQNVKLKNKYKGSQEKVVRFLTELAKDVRKELANAGLSSLRELRGRTDLLDYKKEHLEFSKKKGLDLTYFKNLSSHHELHDEIVPHKVNQLNRDIIRSIKDNKKLEFNITNTDRAIPASLAGLCASQEVRKKLNFDPITWEKLTVEDDIALKFTGPAGQGFGIFLNSKIKVELHGEANDSVGKGLCGGEIIIIPEEKIKLEASQNVIIGNCALYGATSGDLLVHGRGGDRFGVRNSGANAIIEGVGIHALEYMTGGQVIILSKTLGNIGAGMTGGILYLVESEKANINTDYIRHVPFLDEDLKYVSKRLVYFIKKTKSQLAKAILEELELNKFPLMKFIPIGLV